MYYSNYIKGFILIVAFFVAEQTLAQLSKTHYIPPLTSAEFGNANPENQWLYLSTPNGNDVPYTIKPVGQPASSYITGLVSNSNSVDIFLGYGNGQLFVTSSATGKVMNDKGYIIEAEDVIYASVRMEAGGDNPPQAGALVSKGMSALGNVFRVGSFTNENPQNNYLNFVSVMATEDNTVVTFDDLPTGIIIKGYSGSLPISQSLNKGESFIVATNSFDSPINRDGLIGTLVESDKPIVVNCGSANGSFHNGGGRDYGIDQIVDFSKVGDEYIFVKGDGSDDWENVLIVAHLNNTQIFVNGSASASATIDAGEYYVIEGYQYNSNGNMYVQTSNPVFAYQEIGGGSSEANQGMFFVPPLSCNNRGNVNNIAKIDEIGSAVYPSGVTIVTNIDATVTINNLPLSNFNTNGPFSVDGNPNYETYKVTGLSGNVSVECNAELYCSYFNINGAASSGSFYSGFPSAPEINFEAEFETLGNCIDNITLSATNTENFDIFEWYFDDGTGFKPTGIHTPDLTPIVPGKYKLIGIITCSLLELESIEVPVSICPEDSDIDGIIDNLDIDNDNDGILNCQESRGDVTLNIIGTPQLLFQDGSSNTSLATASYSQNSSSGNTNSFTGTNLGSFTSTVQPAIDAWGNYTINFAEPVNIKFMEDISVNHTSVDGEYFIAKIVPAGKNLTLIDPDNRLLVDSNYDGIFENGVVQMSGSEIHFKINPTPSGNTPFELVGDRIDGFSFIHKLSNNSEASTFSGILSLTCFSIDSDGDNIIDSLDSDSDNDGIPDIMEATGSNYLPLSNTDVDINGLDDIFDINAIPVDSDTDGVFDYLDLDSDNDGVYDLEESGSLLPDINFDGIIDNALASIGLNGWVDAAETSPDSGVISYTISDLDTDSLFNYIDSDSDGDLCSDVIEAGFSDGNRDDQLGDNAVAVDSSGIVTNAGDGYSTPNPNYIVATPITITTQPFDTVVCELASTILLVESSNVDSIQWEQSTDGIIWNTITDDTIYSGSTTAELSIGAVPLSYDHYQYRVRLDKINNRCGLYSDEVILTVNPLPMANAVSTIEICDNLDDGDDTNGIVQTFDLENQTNTILGPSQSSTDFTVTYHLSEVEAISGANALSSPHENNLSPNSQTIYVRVQNNATLCVNSNLTFDLIVILLPIANSVSNIEICDNLDDTDDKNGIVQSFDLENQTGTILSVSQSPSDFTVTYHLSSADAISGANALSSPHENNASPHSQTIFVRILNNSTGCINPHLTFDLIVNALPIANPVANLELCDNLDDGNDTDGIVQTFNLESQTSLILGTQNPADFTLTYHSSFNDASTGNNPLASPFENSSSPYSQKIYVRIVNNATGCVNPHYSFDLIVHPLPIVTTSVNLKQCDNDADGISYFNLSEANILISTDSTNETFTYYLSEAQAQKGAINDQITNFINYENPTALNSSVFSRIETVHGCYRTARIDLVVGVSQIPSSFNTLVYNVCDDEQIDGNKRNGIAAFNFSDAEQTIANEFPLPHNFTIKFYNNEADALAEINPIKDISNHRNELYPTTQHIYVRLDSDVVNACLGLGHHITLNVETLPVANPVTYNRLCDDVPSDTEITAEFNTSNLENDLLSGQTAITVTYFNANGNLLTDSNGNPVNSPFPATFRTATQTITARVTNNTTNDPGGPCFDETQIAFVVDVTPIAHTIDMAPVCDDESNDGLYDFDTSTIQSTLLGGQTGMEVHYYDGTGNELSSPLPNPFVSSSQTITVTVINPINTTCFATNTFELVVNPLPDFSVNTPQILCLTEPASTIILDISLEDDPQEVFDYEWTDQHGKLLSNTSSVAVNAPGTYSIALIKTDGTNCSRTRDIVVNPSMIADIDLYDIQIEDDSNNNTITINNENSNLGVGDYEFSLDDEFFFQDEPYFDFVESGIHTIYIRDKNGCGVNSIDVSVIGFPRFFSPNNDGYNDTWQVLGVNEIFYPEAKIYIFNRFGKLIKQIEPNNDSWDGIFNGAILPATDYWFSAELVDINGNIRIRKGHFSLIRK